MTKNHSTKTSKPKSSKPAPPKGSWEEFCKTPGIGDDFMNDRNQPPPQERKF